MQLVYKYRVPLQAGRYLCFPDDNVGLAVSMKHTIQYRQADGSLGEMEVDLLFPGTARTVVRLMEAWRDAKASTLQQGPTLLQIGLRRGHFYSLNLLLGQAYIGLWHTRLAAPACSTHCCHKKLPFSGPTGCAVSNWAIPDQQLSGSCLVRQWQLNAQATPVTVCYVGNTDI